MKKYADCAKKCYSSAPQPMKVLLIIYGLVSLYAAPMRIYEMTTWIIKWFE
jgi:hypothetical protein